MQQPLFDLEQYIQDVPENDQQSMFVAYFGEELGEPDQPILSTGPITMTVCM